MTQYTLSDIEIQEEDRRFGPRPVLPVADGEPDWETGSPTTAEEYLKRVRWEAAHCDQTTQSDIDTSAFREKQTAYIPRIISVAKAPIYCQPTAGWIKETLREFHKIRIYFEQLDADSGELFVNTVISQESTHDIIELELELSHFNTEPEMMDIEALDQVETNQLLRAHIDDFLKLELEDVSDMRSYWLYCLFSRIHRPLHDTTAAAVRSLFKHCSHLRAQLGEKLNHGLTFNAQDLLPRINLLMAISGVYFGQDECLSGMIDIDNFGI